MLEHICSEWVGESQSSNFSRGDGEIEASNPNVTVTQLKSRTAVIIAYGKRVIQEHFYSNVAARNLLPQGMSQRVVSFSEAVVHVELCVLHACQVLFALSGASFGWHDFSTAGARVTYPLILCHEVGAHK